MASLSNWSNTSDYAKSTLGGSVQQFMAKVLSSKTHEVSRSNLWHFDITFPNILAGKIGLTTIPGAFAAKDLNNTRRTLSLYANEVNTPTRQVTTAGAKIVGSEYQYATGSAFSETTVQFYIPRNYQINVLFERWMNIMANDANQYVDYYDDYVCPTMTIYKLERGQGGDMPLDESQLPPGMTSKDVKNKPKWNQVVGMWAMFNVFPKNVGTLQFNNQPGSPLTLDVTFLYERYRFYPKPTIDLAQVV